MKINISRNIIYLFLVDAVLSESELFISEKPNIFIIFKDKQILFFGSNYLSVYLLSIFISVYLSIYLFAYIVGWADFNYGCACVCMVGELLGIVCVFWVFVWWMIVLWVC